MNTLESLSENDLVLEIENKFINDIEPYTEQQKDWDFKSHRGWQICKVFRNKFEREIEKFVGQDWDIIYSILKAKYPQNLVPKNNTIDYYIDSSVEKKVQEKDGILYAPRWCGAYSYTKYYEVNGLYVDPQTRKLCKVPLPPKITPTNVSNTSVYKITRGKNVGQHVKLIKGIWYRIYTIHDSRYSSLINDYIRSTKEAQVQLNSKELKYYNLKND